MQGVNLARRPFVNRRPILRLAILLWIVGVALAILNVRQYVGHWQGTAINRQRLAAVGLQDSEERGKLAELVQELEQVSLSRENNHVAFLNRLIAFRTFPWSGLFDDLEDVLPLGIKLFSVRPEVKLNTDQPKKAPRQRTRRARSRSGSGAAAQTTTEGESTNAGSSAGTPRKQGDVSLRRDEVRLALSGVAKSEDALVELIEVLYASEIFRSPYLPGESLQPDGTVKFSISVVYLTRRRGIEPTVEEPDVATVASVAEGAAATEMTQLEAGEIGFTETTEAGGPGESAGLPAAPPGGAAGRPTVSEGEHAATAERSPLRGSVAGDPETGDSGAGEQPRVPRSRAGRRSRAGAAQPGAGSPGLPGAAVLPGSSLPGSPAPPGSPRSSSPDLPGFGEPAASGTPAVTDLRLDLPSSPFQLDKSTVAATRVGQA